MNCRPTHAAAATLATMVASAFVAFGDGLRAPDFAVPVFSAVASDAPSHVFYKTDAVKFKLKDGYRNSCAYQIMDGFGRQIAAGEWPDGGRGELSPGDLPCGYYTLMLDGADGSSFREPLSFAVVAPTTPNPAGFFAMDTAQSGICGPRANNERFPGESYELVSELCRRAGIGMIRERLEWRHSERLPGQFNWGRFMRNAEYLHSRAVAIDSVYHDATPWAKKDTVSFPDDLLATYSFSKKAGEDFVGKITSWEFWNEPDAHPVDPAWELAAATKAAALGFKAANPELTVLSGSLCQFPINSFAMTAIKNGMLDYVDVFNFHIYKALSEYPEIIGQLRKLLIDSGVPDMPIWITENGTFAEGLGTVENYVPGFMIHSPDQEMRVAEFVPKSQILLQSLAVARDFFFVLPPYYEGHKDFGLMRLDMTVKPGYVAFANLAHQLSHAKLLGEITLAAGVRAFLYEQHDGSQTLAFWSESDLDRSGAAGDRIEIEIRQPDGEYAVSDLFGTVSAVHSRNGIIRLGATRYTSYACGLRGLTADRAPLAAGFLRSPDKSMDPTIVLRPILGEGFTVAETMDSAELTALPGKMTLQVWNLSPIAKSGRLLVRGAKVDGLPDRVTLKPFEKMEFALSVAPELPDGKFRVDLEFGADFAGKRCSRLVVPLRQTGKMLAEGRKLELEYRNPSRWRKNSSGDMSIDYDEGEEAIRFRTVFKPGVDRWIYPEYTLGPSESMKGAAGITFEIKADRNDIAHGLAHTGMLVVLDTGMSHWKLFRETTGQWQVRVIPFDNFNMEQVRKLQIGMNPKCDDFTYFIRNLSIYYD